MTLTCSKEADERIDNASFRPPKGEDQCDYRDVEKREMKLTGCKNYK